MLAKAGRIVKLLCRPADLVRRLGLLREDRQSRALARGYEIGGGFKRIYLVHMRKTGGTSLNHMFLSLGGGNGKDVYDRLAARQPHRIVSGDKVFVAWNRRLIEQGDYFYAFSHIPYHELRIRPGTFVFTCLRDPVQRVLSHYRELVEYKLNDVDHPSMKDEMAWLGDDFGDFLDRIPKAYLLNQLYMLSRDYDAKEALDRVFGFSHYFFTDEFAAGVAGLSEKLGVPLVPIHARKTGVQVEPTRGEMERLRDELEPEILFYRELRDASR